MTEVTRREAAEILGYGWRSLISLMSRQPERWPAPVGFTLVRGHRTPTYDLDKMRRAAGGSVSDDPLRKASSLSDADGIITCLDCGKRFRALGVHLVRTHGITAAEYRISHHLPATGSTVADVTRTQMRATHRKMLTADPTMLDHLAPWQSKERAAELGRRSADAVRESHTIPLAREHRLPGQQYAASQMLKARMEKLEATVRAHGYVSVADAVEQTKDLSAAAAARATGLGASTIRRRRSHG